MTYYDTFDADKNYSAVRFNFGQTVISQEWNELQSIIENKKREENAIFFEEGYVLKGFEFIQDVASVLSISTGWLYIDGQPWKINESSLNYTAISSQVVTIYAYVRFLKIEASDDSDLNHPTASNLPVGGREKYETFLTVTDPDLILQPTNFISLVKVKAFEYDKVTKVLTSIVKNNSGVYNLSRIPGQIRTNQIAPGQIDTNLFDVLLDSVPLRDAIAIRTDDAEGNFIATGGTVIYEDNIISGSPQGIKIRLEAFRAYVKGFQVSVNSANTYYLAHTNTTLTRANESKTYSTGVFTYNLSKNPASAITALDADVLITSQNITRGAGNNDTLLNVPVVSVTSVVQGGTTYVQNTDYSLSGDTILWLTGTRPTQGTTYQVTYVYRRAMIVNTDVALSANRKQITFTETVLPVNASSFQVSYTYFVPRVDTLFVNSKGSIVIQAGLPNDVPQASALPDGVLELAKISVPAGTHLGNTFLNTNGYTVPSGLSIDYTNVQIPATKMLDHRERNITLTNLAFNDTINTGINYLSSQDPTSAKLGSFGDRLYDDRLSDYGQPSQNIVFDTERRVGSGARSTFISSMQHNDSLPLTVVENKGFITLANTETVAIEQLQWSDSVDLQPYINAIAVRSIDVPNKDLVKGQPFEIYGYNWLSGENNIEFFLNGVKLTGITILTGTAGGVSDSVNATNKSFVVRFTVPGNLPLGYQRVRAASAVTTNWVDQIVGLQTSAAPLPPPRSTTFVNAQCGELRYIINHGDRNVADLLIAKHPTLGEIQKFNCATGFWEFVSYWDPIAQTFIPSEDMFISAVDLWFVSKDTASDVYVSVIPTENGVPTTNTGRLGLAVVPSSSVLTNGSPTKVTFSNPVFVQQGVPYAVFLECPTPGYSVMYSRLGKLDRSTYAVTPAGFRTFTSASSNAIGPLPELPVNDRRTVNTIHRFVQKDYTFTPTENVQIFQIDSNVYIGPDALSNEALAEFSITDVVSNTVIWSTNRVLNSVANPFCGKFTAVDYKDLVAGSSAGGSIQNAISLLANRQYRFRIRANQSYAYKFLRDNYQDDGVANVKLLAFTEATKTYEIIKQNTLTSGQLFFSPDAIVWQGYPDSDLRFRVYKAQFPVNSNSTILMKKFKTVPGSGELSLSDSVTHFTSLLNAVTPEGANISMDYSLDNGVTWLSHTPVVFKQRPQTDDTIDKKQWAFFNYGFFNEQRFKENQFDTRFVPSTSNKKITLPALSTEILYRIKMNTTNANVTPVLDSKNWSISFEKFGLSTVYFSRTQLLQANATTGKVYFWASIPSGVTYQVSLTLDGENTNPTYVSKTSASATRVIESATNLIEYRFDYSSGDLTAQAVKTRPKVRITFTTSDRYAQPEVRFVGFNTF